MASSFDFPDLPADHKQTGNGKLLCLTICGYRRKGMSEEDYRRHMTEVSAPMSRELMVRYGILRWTQIHNQSSTRVLMRQLFDPQMANVADFDCFSQVVFRSLDNYKRMKQDPVYREKLVGDHEKFADTKRSMMTIGWISQFIDHGVITDGFDFSQHLDANKMTSPDWLRSTALMAGSFLSGAMMSLSIVAVPVLLDTTTKAGQLTQMWTRMYHYGHVVLPTLAVATSALYSYMASREHRRRSSLVTAGIVTIGMLPFTWLFMVPTNDALFGLDKMREANTLTTGLEDVQGLVSQWSFLHVLRSLFPLAGGFVGGFLS